MTGKEIEKSRTHLRNAGTPTDRNQTRAMLIARLENEIESLRAAKETVRQDFRRLLTRWQTREAPETVPVCAIPSDVHDMRLYRLTAVFASLRDVSCRLGLLAPRRSLVVRRRNRTLRHDHPAWRIHAAFR